MKRTKILVLILTVSIMLVGAGYAAWSETLPLDASVNSYWLNIGLESSSTTTYSQGTFEPTAYGTECVITRGDNARGEATNSSTATVEFKNLFPGVTQTATIEFINDSPIPVRLTEVIYSDILNADPELVAATTVRICSEEKDGPGVFYPLSTLKGNTYTIPSIIPPFFLEPGEQLTYIIEVSLPYLAGNNTQSKSFEFDITTTFTQK